MGPTNGVPQREMLKPCQGALSVLLLQRIRQIAQRTATSDYTENKVSFPQACVSVVLAQ
jgi:hypothetical protein